MMRRITAALLAGAAALTLAGSAAADPVLTGSGKTAWLGESNYLYLQEASGLIRQLPSPIIDLVGMDGTNIYCLTITGRLYAVRLDGSASSVAAAAPKAEELETYKTRLPYSLKEGGLYRTDAAGGGMLLAADTLLWCANENAVFYVTRDADGTCRLQGQPMGRESMTLGAVVYPAAAVPEPATLFAGSEAVALVGLDHAVTVYNLQSGDTVTLPASSEATAAAVYANGRLFRYTVYPGGGWTLEKAESLTLPDTRATASPLPTSTPFIVRPTAVPTPTRVPWATNTPRATVNDETEDLTIRKWDRGSRVRRMQQRLSELGYPVGKVDGSYGDATELAVNLFQSQIGVAEHSYMTYSTQQRLFAGGAPDYDPYMDLHKGNRGVRVRALQEALRNQGIDPGKIDGIYGQNTVRAVAAYQARIGLALSPGEEPGVNASRWLLMNLFTAPPAGPTAPVDPVITAEPSTPTDLNTAVPPAVTDPPAPPPHITVPPDMLHTPGASAETTPESEGEPSPKPTGTPLVELITP